jgi:hypothetical protein
LNFSRTMSKFLNSGFPQELRVTISLLPTADDALVLSPEYQAELGGFVRSLESAGAQIVSSQMYFQDSEESVVRYLGEFTVTFATGIGTAIGVWLHARYGRKVKLKIDGDKVDAQASSVEEVNVLLKRAEEYHQSRLPHRPKSRPKSDGRRL